VTKLGGGAGFAAIGDMPQLDCHQLQKYNRILRSIDQISLDHATNTKHRIKMSTAVNAQSSLPNFHSL
jgi:hypothetical protein